MTNLLKSTLLAATVLSVANASAFAADSVAPATGYSWEGAYAGFSVGYARDNARYEEPDDDWYSSTHEYNGAGLQYGVQAGYNWQNGTFVYGIEGDFSGYTNNRNTIFSSDNDVNNNLMWMGSVRGRAGVALDRTWIYGTAGLAIADFDRSWIEAQDTSDSWPDLGATKAGFIGGVGVETAISSHWTARAEALVATFGDNTSINGDDFPLTIDDTVAQLRFGVNYRFGAGGDAMPVSYEGTPADFSGFYVGAGFGGHRDTTSMSDIDYYDYGSTYDDPAFGVDGSVYAGYNYQFGAGLVGVEAEFAYLGGGRSFLGDVGSTTIGGGIEWTAAVKARTGIVAGNTLLYVLGGVAVAEYDAALDDGNEFDASGTYFGYTTGVGIEHAVSSNITARLEGTFSSFDGKKVGSPTSSDYHFRGNADLLSVRAGLSYNFGGGVNSGTGALAATANWSGAYVGVDGIFAHHRGTSFDRTYYEHGGSYTTPSFGVGGGAHAGYDMQRGNLVYGVVGDVAFYTNSATDTSQDYRELHSELNWMATARGRVGLATGDSLFYTTAGVAVADIDLTHDYLPKPTCCGFDMGGTQVGWVAGVGAEHMITANSSVKMEALFTNFAENGAENGETCSDNLVTEPCEMVGRNNNFQIKMGYSYRFGG